MGQEQKKSKIGQRLLQTQHATHIQDIEIKQAQ